ncbi:MAG: sulfide/dihydroorotate dehydrogenase-like FAD/NAD-binding protein [Propionibacteriaceae bacterium]|jgi:glutamate synthase (NADPH/NADH) small chain|nr:sulfide/dihydroorotate dehydrogenase-like FAD/NAD-binding protein [Propionibacteriaceae bacterium]
MDTPATTATPTTVTPPARRAERRAAAPDIDYLAELDRLTGLYPASAGADRDDLIDQLARTTAGLAAAKTPADKRLAAEPELLDAPFSPAALVALAAEFRPGSTLEEPVVTKLWAVMEAGGDGAALVQRFLWGLPIGRKRIFLRAVDQFLSARYPMFAGLSESWPASNGVGPVVRDAWDRSNDFGLVNTGYLGYLDLGYSLRDVELIVWLEAMRDNQCPEHYCELGKCLPGTTTLFGGCPVQIHITRMFELLGQGRFDQALELLEECNPLPDVTGRVCPQELQCQGACIHKLPMSIGQIEWFLPEWDKLAHPGAALDRLRGRPDPWATAAKPPVAIVGSGPSGLINAYLLARAGFPVTVFEAFHELGGVLRYGIPQFRLPNELIDDVVEKCRLLGARFVTSFVVGKTASLQDLVDAGFWRVFVGTGAGLPRFLDVPGEHLLGVMSANEFLTRVNLMGAALPDHATPLPAIQGKRVLVVGGGNTAMDAARTARRLGGAVTLVYRRTQAEMPARAEELEHALEEGVELTPLRSPVEFRGDPESGFVTLAVVERMELGEPDASGRRSPQPTGELDEVPADLVIMALGNAANPILKDSEPRLLTGRGGAFTLREGSQETSLDGVYSGGDAARGGSTAIRAAGDGRSAAFEILAAGEGAAVADVAARVTQALAFTESAATANVITAKRNLSPGIEELWVKAPAIARSARAGQFVRVLADPAGELIPLTLADWDADAGTICLVVQGVGATSRRINAMAVGDVFAGIAGPLGRPSEIGDFDRSRTVVFTAGGLGLPPVYPIAREHLRRGNHVTLIAGFRTQDLVFWTGAGEFVPRLQAEFGDLLDVVYATDDGSFGVHGFVTTPLEAMLKEGRPIAEVVAIGPPLMMRAVGELTRTFGVKTVVSVNAIMVDATGMCGACMVPVEDNGRLVRRHACLDGPEFDAHTIDWAKFLPRFKQFKAQEQAALAA